MPRVPFSGYDSVELAYRPTEHILEALSWRDFEAALGMCRGTSCQVRAGERRLTIGEELQLRDWLERQ